MEWFDKLTTKIGDCLGLSKETSRHSVVETDYIEESKKSYLIIWRELFGEQEPLELHGTYTQDDFKSLISQEESYTFNLFILKVIDDFICGKLDVFREDDWIRFKIGKDIHSLSVDKHLYLRLWCKRNERDMVFYGQGHNPIALNPYILLLFKEYVDSQVKYKDDKVEDMNRTIYEYIGSK